MAEIIYKIIEIYESYGVLVKDIHFSFEQGGIYLYIAYAYHDKRFKQMHYIGGGVLNKQNADMSNLNLILGEEIVIAIRELKEV